MNAKQALTLSELFLPEQGGGRLRVGDVIDAAGSGYGLGLFLIALPAIVPLLPPGASMVVGLLIILVSVQMLVGLERLWLPSRVRNYAFSEKASQSLRLHGYKWAKRIEKISHARWEFMTGRFGAILVTIPMIGIGVVLFLPLPFLNTLPALAIMSIGLGIANRDGVFVMAGLAVCLGILTVAAMSPGLMQHAMSWFR